MAAAMGRAFESDTFRFFDDIVIAQEWLGRVDVVHSNSALQYVPLPEETLDRLLDINSSHLALLRCSLSCCGRAVQVQESMLSMQYIGPLPAGVSDRAILYPHTSIAQDVFEAKVAASGYTLIAGATGGEPGSGKVQLMHDNHLLYHRLA